MVEEPCRLSCTRPRPATPTGDRARSLDAIRGFSLLLSRSLVGSSRPLRSDALPAMRNKRQQSKTRRCHKSNGPTRREPLSRPAVKPSQIRIQLSKQCAATDLNLGRKKQRNYLTSHLDLDSYCCDSVVLHRWQLLVLRQPSSP